MADRTSQLGALAPRGQGFCPYASVAKFPYKYIDRPLMQPVSDNFFANGLFRERGWTLYYIHTYGLSSKPLLLLPALEVETFIDDINKELDTCLKFPRPNREPGFLLRFDEEGSPRPRYLGRVDLEVTVDEMESKIPPPEYKAAGEMEEPEDRSFEAFKAKMEAAIQAGKNKSKSQRESKKRQRVVQKQGWCEQLKRAQCYLGIRPRKSAAAQIDPMQASTGDWDDYLKAQKASEIARCVNLPVLDVTGPVPYPFSQAPIFVCVDVEAWEKDHNTITEIGISTLDSDDLVDLPPGEDGKAWMTAIRPRHFRISEYQHLVNSDFVSGCADRFEKDFGISEFISIKDAPQVIASCFKPPYSAAFQMPSHKGPGDCAARSSIVNQDGSKRNIILVGHDIKSDINYMRNVGYDVSNRSNVLEAIDTADMFKALKQEGQSGSLGRVLLELEMVGWNLHNAGNDAAYTLQAMIGIAFTALHDKDARKAAAAKERAAKMAQAELDAQARLKEEAEEWEAADIDEGDGGVPVSIPRLEPHQPIGFAAYRGAGAAKNQQQQEHPLPKKPNAAARKAMAEKEARKQKEKEEASMLIRGGGRDGAKTPEGEPGPGANHFGGLTRKENVKQGLQGEGVQNGDMQDGGVKVETNGAGAGKGVLSMDDLAMRFQSRLARMDLTDEEGEGGVKL